MKLNLKTEEVEGTPEELILFVRNTKGVRQEVVTHQEPQNDSTRSFRTLSRKDEKLVNYLRQNYPTQKSEGIISTLRAMGYAATWQTVCRLCGYLQIRRPKKRKESKETPFESFKHEDKGLSKEGLGYLKIAYPTLPRKEIMAVLKELTWAQIGRIARKSGFERKSRTLDRADMNKVLEATMTPTKICMKCSRVFHRQVGKDNYAWHKTKYCNTCFTKIVGLKAKTPNFPMLSTAKQTDATEFFRRLIADKAEATLKTHGYQLNIRHEENWRWFVNEVEKNFQKISDYFQSPNLIKKIEENGITKIKYG